MESHIWYQVAIPMPEHIVKHSDFWYKQIAVEGNRLGECARSRNALAGETEERTSYHLMGSFRLAMELAHDCLTPLPIAQKATITRLSLQGGLLQKEPLSKTQKKLLENMATNYNLSLCEE
jgi:hypothetical protein